MIIPTATRRSFLKTSASVGVTTATLATTPRPLLALLCRTPEPIPPIDDPRLKQLTSRALDAARTAGVTYADVRLTHTRNRRFRTPNSIDDGESITAGVRVSLNGYWGFAASPVWSPDEMARLAREAASIAKTNALGKPREMILAPVDVVRDGRWTTPFEIDPFEIYPPEIMDYLLGLAVEASQLPSAANDGTVSYSCKMQNKAFAATTGAYFVQRTYLSDGNLIISTTKKNKVSTEFRAGGGFELMQRHDFMGELRKAMAQNEAIQKLPIKPLDVGRYDTVFDAGSVTGVLTGSIGRASELDRALGYEANAGGTSYLGEPADMLGTFKVGNSFLNVTANRTDPDGLATCKWDDEGVETTLFPLVAEGILVNYHTNREGAGWLGAHTTHHSSPLRSNGCAAVPEAIHAPLVHTANLTMTPGTETLEEDDLIKSVKKGVAFQGLYTAVDFQQSGGIGIGGIAFEVVNGKRTAILPNAGILFRAQEFWKNIIAIGGVTSVKRDKSTSHKGEPGQMTELTVSTVPVLMKEVTVIDYTRKA